MPSLPFANTTDGHLVSILSLDRSVELRKPRRRRFGTDGIFYCVAQDAIVFFDFAGGAGLRSAVQFPRLNGQAIALFP